MAIRFSISKSLKFSFLVINLFCATIFSREYVLKVVQESGSFHITTNIPKAGAEKGKNDTLFPTTSFALPIPTDKPFNAVVQKLSLAENGNKIELDVEVCGHIVIRQLDIPDTLKIENMSKDPMIFVTSHQPLRAHELLLQGSDLVNDSDIYVDILKASFSGRFINNRLLVINKNSVASNQPAQQSNVSCKEFENYNQLTLNGQLVCTVNDFSTTVQILPVMVV